ncbi:MAG: hypothetical protein GY795_32555 [Desulfobacterales bacterium]|nr:hypothetical protein [Desulfobacterales bacterium]
MKFWQSRVQCQNFISALLQTVNRKMKNAKRHKHIITCAANDSAAQVRQCNKFDLDCKFF